MKVAILIPTMNRPDFIERTVRYYDAVKSPHPIYIGDASGTETAARTAVFLRQCGNVEVRYFHWEGLGAQQTTVKLAERAQVECNYCALQGDDDYFVPSSLSQCAEFLSENSDHRTAQGRAAMFTLDRPGPFGEIRSLGKYWGVNALEQETSIERLVSFGNKYFVSAFSTHRTEEFVRDSEYYSEIDDNNFSELIHCFTFAIRGKSKFIDCLYLIRHVHEDIYHPSALDWIIQEHWSSCYHRTLNVLSLALQDTSDLPSNNAKRIVSEVLKMYMEPLVVSKIANHERSFSAMLRNSVPDYLKNIIRQSILDARDMRLLRSKKSLFYDQFLPVLGSLTKASSLKGASQV